MKGSGIWREPSPFTDEDGTPCLPRIRSPRLKEKQSLRWPITPNLLLRPAYRPCVKRYQRLSTSTGVAQVKARIQFAATYPSLARYWDCTAVMNDG